MSFSNLPPFVIGTPGVDPREYLYFIPPADGLPPFAIGTPGIDLDQYRDQPIPQHSRVRHSVPRPRRIRQLPSDSEWELTQRIIQKFYQVDAQSGASQPVVMKGRPRSRWEISQVNHLEKAVEVKSLDIVQTKKLQFDQILPVLKLGQRALLRMDLSGVAGDWYAKAVVSNLPYGRATMEVQPNKGSKLRRVLMAANMNLCQAIPYHEGNFDESQHEQQEFNIGGKTVVCFKL